MWEWNEEIFDDGLGPLLRGLRGGDWANAASHLAASSLGSCAAGAGLSLGLRVASLVPECGDGIDNDADTLIDSPADPGCSSPLDATEASPPDSDGDLVDDGLDNCPYEPNPTQRRERGRSSM